MYLNLYHVLTILLAGLLAAGCSTVASNPESTMRIESDPAGATCTLENDRGFRHEAVTPTSISLHRDLAPLTIECASPGHASIREELKMDGNALVLGNILIGGIIGVAVDAASGAAEKFPDRISVLLDPSEFETAKSRDEWYEKRKARLEQAYRNRLATLDQEDNECKFNYRCNDIIEVLAEQRQTDLAKLEKLREAAVVRTASTAVVIDGKRTCLSQVNDNTWQALPCGRPKPKARSARVKVDGKEECLVQTGSKVWESRPCPPKKPQLRTTRVIVDGREECLLEVAPKKWEARPCSN